jgi:hypothetical protein
MRIVEILILIALLPGMIALSVRPSRRPGWLRAFAWAALALMLVHLAVEGYRWQMIPAYLLVVLGCLRTLKTPPRQATRDSRWRKALRLASVALTLLACSATLFLGVEIPVFNPPAPIGPYPVGTTRLYFIDGSRQDPFAPNPRTPRELLVVAWYPAQVAPGLEPNPFGPPRLRPAPSWHNCSTCRC